VHSRPQVQPDVLGTGQDVGGAAQCSSGGVKGGQEAVPGRHFMSAVAAEGGPDHGVVVVGEPGSLPRTDPGLMLSRSHDVSEEDGHGQHIGLGPAVGTGQELLDLVHQGIGVASEEQVVFAGEDSELDIADVFSQVAARPQGDVTISLTMQDQGGNRDGGQKRTYIGFVHGPPPGGGVIRAATKSARAGQPRSEALVGYSAGGHDFQAFALTPRFSYGGNTPIEVLTSKATGVVVLSHEMGIAVEQNKSAESLGMGDCEVDRRWAMYAASQNRRLL
jgi:hypothetical protein